MAGRRQERLDVLPRVHRGWTYAGLRAATNVLQRDLNTAVIADEMRKGTKSIYVDYVDYDEIAHHAWHVPPESLAALDGLDRVLGHARAGRRLTPPGATTSWCSLTTASPRAQTFHDRFGADLGEVCTQLMKEEVASLDASVEDWGRVGLPGRRSGGHRDHRQSRPARRCRQQATRRPRRRSRKRAAVSVLGSGNLGLLYVHSPARLTLEDLQERWPSLIPGLCAHEGIGFVAGLDSAGVPWVLGAEGRVRLDTGEVTGQDPLRPYGDHSARVLRRAVVMPEAPDLYINSRVE